MVPPRRSGRTHLDDTPPRDELPYPARVKLLEERVGRFRRRVLREIKSLRTDQAAGYSSLIARDDAISRDMKTLLEFHSAERTKWQKWTDRLKFFGTGFYRCVVVMGFTGRFVLHPETAKALSGFFLKLWP